MADSKSAEPVTVAPYDYPSLTLPVSELTDEEEKPDNVRMEENPEEKEENPEEKEEIPEEKKEKKLLLGEETIQIEISPNNEEETPTLPISDKKKEIDKTKAKLSKYLFPFSRIRDAWSDSSNIFQFLGRATCIIFQTAGWFTCVGGIPFFSLVALIIGSIYVDDCPIQPNIPVYLIVSGVFGTIQHFIAIWIMKVPKESKGKLRVTRSYCRLINAFLHLFLMIWFILGCVWVYSAFSEVDYKYPEKEEYCHKTLYLFSFWILNLSFVLLGLLLCITMCIFLGIAASEK